MKERQTRDCAKILLAALEQGKALSRAEMVAMGLVTASEADRALRSLRAAGAIRRSEACSGLRSADVRYEPAAVPPNKQSVAQPLAARRRNVCFEGLLAAWQIAPPSSLSHDRSRVLVRDRFAQEDALEDASFAAET
jgi:hypothetical protein